MKVGEKDMIILCGINKNEKYSWIK